MAAYNIYQLSGAYLLIVGDNTSVANIKFMTAAVHCAVSSKIQLNEIHLYSSRLSSRYSSMFFFLRCWFCRLHDNGAAAALYKLCVYAVAYTGTPPNRNRRVPLDDDDDVAKKTTIISNRGALCLKCLCMLGKKQWNPWVYWKIKRYESEKLLFVPHI